jgi:hypothetical protein
MMSMAKRKFDFLKTKGKWGAKSPDDEKIVAMTAKINTLKGQLKLDPKLSAIAGEGEEGDNKSSKTRRRMSTGRRYLPKRAKLRKESKLENIPSIGASTTRPGPCTSPTIASL